MQCRQRSAEVLPEKAIAMTRPDVFQQQKGTIACNAVCVYFWRGDDARRAEQCQSHRFGAEHFGCLCARVIFQKKLPPIARRQQGRAVDIAPGEGPGGGDPGGKRRFKVGR